MAARIDRTGMQKRELAALDRRLDPEHPRNQSIADIMAGRPTPPVDAFKLGVERATELLDGLPELLHYTAPATLPKRLADLLDRLSVDLNFLVIAPLSTPDGDRLSAAVESAKAAIAQTDFPDETSQVLAKRIEGVADELLGTVTQSDEMWGQLSAFQTAEPLAPELLSRLTKNGLGALRSTQDLIAQILDGGPVTLGQLGRIHRRLEVNRGTLALSREAVPAEEFAEAIRSLTPVLERLQTLSVATGRKTKTINAELDRVRATAQQIVDLLAS